MNNRNYKVIIDETVVAERMALNMALILVKALFEEHHNEPSMKISVVEHERTEACCDDR